MAKKKEKKPVEEGRDKNGRFAGGNSLGKRSWFGEDNDFATKYDDKYCDELIEWFIKGMNDDGEVIYEERYKDGEVVTRIPKMIRPPKLPTFELFAASIGVTKRTLYNWADEHRRFSLAMQIAKNIQLGVIKVNGSNKTFDSNFSKFLCINEHDMTDKVQVAGTDEQGKAAPFTINIKVID